jgi:hypothetical protein
MESFRITETRKTIEWINRLKIKRLSSHQKSFRKLVGIPFNHIVISHG